MPLSDQRKIKQDLASAREFGRAGDNDMARLYWNRAAELCRAKFGKTPHITENGYEIIHNSYHGTWQVSHPEIGLCAEFVHVIQAIHYAQKG